MSIQRRAHLVVHYPKKKNISLEIRYAGECVPPDDVLLLIGEAWYHDVKKFGGDPVACMARIHEVMKDHPIDRSGGTF